jgi:hypothetical protein
MFDKQAFPGYGGVPIAADIYMLPALVCIKRTGL